MIYYRCPVCGASVKRILTEFLHGTDLDQLIVYWCGRVEFVKRRNGIVYHFLIRQKAGKLRYMSFLDFQRIRFFSIEKSNKFYVNKRPIQLISRKGISDFRIKL